ncbi:MAG: glycosyltransferase [Sulfolobales archaeon]|nr:glycosyltransferase [Sulfolobales archaeon]
MSSRSILVIADVGLSKTASTGGVLRSSRSIREYSRHFNTYLILPPTYASSIDIFMDLKKELGAAEINHLKVWPRILLGNERLTFIYPTIPSKVLRLLLGNLNRHRNAPDAIVVLNETYDCLSIGRVAKEYFNSPSLALLQLPLLYHDRSRREQIEKAFELWYKEVYSGEWFGKLIRELRTRLELLTAWSRFIKNILKSYDVLVAVSKAIVFEMGEEWFNKFYVLDPGVSLDAEDLELISEVRRHVRGKESYVVFGGRVDALKGFIEALYAFRKVAEVYPSIKLAVTGYIGTKLKPRIERLTKRLGLEDRVTLTGTLPRVERFRIVASAKLMLYPSHVDAFPYAVLESLCLGTPVVAYNIPALRMYYSDNSGVTFVKEGDVEALAIEALNVLSKEKVDISPPQLRSWDDIMKEEVALINKLINESS